MQTATLQQRRTGSSAIDDLLTGTEPVTVATVMHATGITHRQARDVLARLARTDGSGPCPLGWCNS